MPTQRRDLRHEVLDAIRRGHGTTRRSIEAVTGRSRSVVAQTVSELIAEGLVVDAVASTALRSRGRPATELRFVSRAGRVAAVDVTHRAVSIALATTDGHIVHEASEAIDTDADGPAAVAIARRLLTAALAGESPLALALSVPFPVDVRSGQVHSPAQLASWRNLDPVGALRDAFGCPVVVDNDANLGAWAEHRSSLRDGASLLYVKIDDGVGTGFLVDGEIYHGAHGLGGEIGHTLVRPGGEECRCGRFGCLEAEVSPDAIAHRLGIDTVDLADAATSSIGGRVLHAAGWRVGQVVVQLCNFLDPPRVVVGGSIGLLGGPVIAGLRDAFLELGQNTAVQGMPVAVSRFGTSAELVGAVDRAVQRAWVS